jgi:hypothetical protein
LKNGRAYPAVAIISPNYTTVSTSYHCKMALNSQILRTSICDKVPKFATLWFGIIRYGWKVRDENDRMTLHVLLPTGMTKANCSPCIDAGGTQVKIVLEWPEELLDTKLPMFAGTTMPRDGSDPIPFYDKGHVNVMSFCENVKFLRNHDDKNPVKSVFRCNLPATVKEQFSDFDVPSPLASIKLKIAKKDCWCLTLEMMCLRSNYKSVPFVEDFEIDFSHLTI